MKLVASLGLLLVNTTDPVLELCDALGVKDHLGAINKGNFSEIVDDIKLLLQ
jgi:hypothetical protein